MDEETAGDNELRELAVLMSLTALDMPAGGTVAAAVGLGTVAAESRGGRRNRIRVQEGNMEEESKFECES